MKRVLFLLLIIFSCNVYALLPLDAQTMEAQVHIGDNVTLVQTGSQYRMDEVQGRLSWFPRENRLQQVESLSTSPTAQQSDDLITFTWKNPTQEEHISVDATVLTRNAIVPVRDHITFPLRQIDSDVEKYLAPGEITDEDSDIQTLAQELAAGKTDAYDVVFTLADWTTSNVNYSLASLGQPAVQKSSQVLKSRYGKCDELTSLFISMNRALGIPARFVAGYAYTNSDQFSTPWGGHGWAEVWLPGQGWVPFDVTYGEYGYLDAGHVALKIAPDAKETSIDFTAKGNDFELQTQPLDITVTPTKMTPQSDPPIDITLSTSHQKVGFGSTVLILATVENKADYYVSTRIDIAKTTNTEALSMTHNNVLLKPGESRVLPFLVKIDDNLDHGYVYTFPMKVYARLGADATITITANEDGPVFDKSSYAQDLARYTQEEYIPSALSITCKQKNSAYVGQNITHECTAWGATTSSLRICESTDCSTVQLNNGEFTITTTDENAGVYTRTYTTQSGNRVIRFFVTSNSVVKPSIAASITGPASATPDELVTETLTLNHTGSTPRNLTARLQVQHTYSDQKLDTLDVPATFEFTFPGRMLRPGDNNITTIISYTDERGTHMNQTVSSMITLTDVGVVDWITFTLDDATQWLLHFFN